MTEHASSLPTDAIVVAMMEAQKRIVPDNARLDGASLHVASREQNYKQHGVMAHSRRVHPRHEKRREWHGILARYLLSGLFHALT